MRYQLTHETTYVYASVAEACHNIARLTPRALVYQQLLDFDLTIDPAPTTQHGYRDYFGNHVTSFAIYEPHERLTIAAASLVRVDGREPFDREDSMPCREVLSHLRSHRDATTVDALQYVFDSTFIQASPDLRAFARRFFQSDRAILSSALELTTHIHQEFTYDPEATTIGTSIIEVLEKRRGVCQDFAHLAISSLRSMGLACRYVSGYLRTAATADEPRLEGADASHAWISVYCPRMGWVDFDPTNGCLVDERYITIGWGRDFHDLSPVKGIVLGGAESTLSVAVRVVPLKEVVS